MPTPSIVEGRLLRLQPLTREHASSEYLSWMRDEAVNQYLESRFATHTLETLRAFISAMNSSADNYLFGMFERSSGRHVGNIKIGSIKDPHRHADLGLVIGERSAWGRGYATEAISRATQYAFEQLDLNKLYAGMYAENMGCFRAFIKSGYTQIGTMRQHVFCNGRFMDSFLVEKCRR
jgi:ribosomal-protein-alanine N-acetyltransferase